MSIEVKSIEFDTILPFWQNFLWPGRTSKIETHSAIVYNTMPYEYDGSYFDYKPTFFGAFCDGTLAGVNSGHRTGDESYRSRGLYVMPNYRGMALGKHLLDATIQQAKNEGCKFCWSIPRFTSRNSYFSAGFEQVGEMFPTETSESNFYVRINVSDHIVL